MRAVVIQHPFIRAVFGTSMNAGDFAGCGIEKDVGFHGFWFVCMWGSFSRRPSSFSGFRLPAAVWIGSDTPSFAVSSVAVTDQRACTRRPIRHGWRISLVLNLNPFPCFGREAGE